MKKIPWTNFLFLAGVVLQLTWYALLWTVYATTPELVREADFRAFYTAGRISREYGPGLVYDADLERYVQEEAAGHPLDSQSLLTYNHPPLLLPVLSLIVNEDYVASYVRYCLVLAALLFMGLPVLYRTLKAGKWPVRERWLVLIGAALFEPIFIGILKGQDSILLVLGGLIWLHGLVRDDDRLAGLGLALTVIRPQIALLLAAVFLFRRPKVFGWFCLGALALAAYSYLLVGTEGFRDYLGLILLSSTGQGYGLNEMAMFNFVGMLIRLFPGSNPDILHALGWGLYLLAMIGLAIPWKAIPRVSSRQVALVVAMSLLFSPHLHYHDLALLIVPVVCLAIVRVDAGRLSYKAAAWMPLLTSLLFLFTGLWDPARYAFAYLLTAFLVLGSLFPGLIFRRRTTG